MIVDGGDGKKKVESKTMFQGPGPDLRLGNVLGRASKCLLTLFPVLEM